MFGANYFGQMYFAQGYAAASTTPPPPVTALFRKTLSMIGTHTGGRQAQQG